MPLSTRTKEVGPRWKHDERVKSPMPDLVQAQMTNRDELRANWFTPCWQL